MLIKLLQRVQTFRDLSKYRVLVIEVIQAENENMELAELNAEQYLPFTQSDEKLASEHVVTIIDEGNDAWKPINFITLLGARKFCYVDSLSEFSAHKAKSSSCLKTLSSEAYRDF